jgi:primosomal protein N' (replication factor Y) (superfamily II helicase)
VAVDLPRLELDRPFTYLLPEDHAPGTGLLVSIPFHGRTVRGWVLGPTDDRPARTLPVRSVLSRVPLFDHRLLALYRWVSERYVVPLSVAISRAHPPRVASEEATSLPGAERDAVEETKTRILHRYVGGDALVDACRSGAGSFVVRPLPDEEAAACEEAVASCLAGGRDAVVLVPEAEPLPDTARRVADAFGDRVVVLVGGDRRERYRVWLDVLGGRYRVVVGTRPAVFAPLPRVGLVWVHREAHPAHREERAPYHHVREVARARARLEDAVCVLAGLSPSAESAALVEDGEISAVRPPRGAERAAAPLVETVHPGPEDRSPRLTRLLKAADGALLVLSRHGYGVVRVCRDCGLPVRCPACGGTVTIRDGMPRCVVCEADVVCPNCGSTRFGTERGGTERLAEWAGRVTRLPVTRVESAGSAVPPERGRVIVGTAAAVKDFGPRRVSLVGILDPDRARRRAGLAAPEQAVATWMEAAGWAGPRDGGGRVLVHTREPGDPAIQALIRWDPWHFHRAERRRRGEAGFPPGDPVFRVTGSPDLPAELAGLRPVTLLTSASDGQAICLVTLRPDAVARFGERVRTWAEAGMVTRVEAEPQL